MKVRFQHFLTPPHYTNLQNSMISFDYIWFLAKNLSNYVSLLWKLHNPGIAINVRKTKNYPYLKFNAQCYNAFLKHILFLSPAPLQWGEGGQKQYVFQEFEIKMISLNMIWYNSSQIFDYYSFWSRKSQTL